MFRTHTAALLAAAVLAACSADDPDTLLASAKDYLAKNDRTAAVIQLKNALQQRPDLAEARLLLGQALLENGEVAAAEKELRRAMELKVSADQVAPPLARALLLLGESKKVTDEFGKAELTAAEGKADLHTTLAQAQLAQGNTEAAKEALAAALAADPEHAPARLTRARIKAGEQDLPGALAEVEAVLARAPKRVEGWQLKGDILLAQGQAEPALAAYRQALEVKPDHLLAHAVTISLLSQQNKLEEAAKQFEAMKQVAPKHPQTLYLQAMMAYRQKDFPAAREAIQQHLRAAPDSLLGLLMAGAIEFELKSYAQAEANLLKVLQRAPEQAFARRVLIGTYLRTGQPTKALDALKPLLDRFAQNSDMLALAGEVYVQNGDAAKGAEYFEKAAALDPKNPEKRTAVALTYLAKGEAERGFRELEEVAGFDSGIRADLALIAAHLQRRQPDKALQAIAALEKKKPGDPLIHNLRGGALLAKGDVPGARRSFEQALAKDAAYFPAADNLAKLDLAQKKPDEARKRFEGVLAKEPKHLQAMLAMAGLRAAAGAPAAEVTALLDKAVAAYPTETAPRLGLIAYHQRNKDSKQALAAARDALAALPDAPEILDLTGLVQQAAGETHQALATYNRLATLQPSSPMPHLRMAAIHAAGKDSESALQSLRKALVLKPDLVEAQRAIIGLDLSAGRMEQALALAKEVQRQRPKQSVGFILEGDIHASKKAWASAAAAYRAGLKQVGSADLAIRLHSTLGAAGEAEAAPFAAAWLKDHPKDAAFRVYLAERATTTKDYGTAVAHYRKLLEAQPDNPAMLNNLAWAAGQLKDPKALEYAEQANKLAPNQPAIMDTLGVLLAERGDTARGIELLQQAVALAPDAAAVRLNLARVLIQAGNKDAARKELDTLAKLGDKFPAQAEVAALQKGM